MAVVRLEALRALADVIGAEIPDFLEICAGPAPVGQLLVFPSLAINPGKYLYHPDQALEQHDPGPGKVVMNVGRFQGSVELRIFSENRNQRAELEQRVVNFFLGRVGAPGVRVTVVSACPELGDWVASWELEDFEWRDEQAFDNNWQSAITVTSTLPALVTRCDAYTIDQLQLGVTSDFVTAATPDLHALPDVEVVQINQDGTFAPVPAP